MKGRTRASSRSNVEKENKEESSDSRLGRDGITGDLLWLKLHGSTWWPAQVVDENSVSRSSKPSKRSRSDVLVRLYASYIYKYANPIRCRLEFENILKENNGSYSEILKSSLEQDLHRLKLSKAGIARGENSQGKPSKQDNYNKIKEAEDLTSISDANTQSKNDNLRYEKAEKARSKKRKQEEEQKKVGPDRRDSPKLTRFSSRKSGPTAPQAPRKNGNLLPEKSPANKGKRQKQDVVHKEEVAPNTSNTVSLRCHSQATTSVGRDQELSARRRKVTQSLGLVAPSGSPFSPSSIAC